MKFIFGLGNPGKKYQYTRHNLGKMIAERFAKERGIRVNKHLETFSYGEDNKRETIVVLSDVYMNNSGEVVKELVKKMDMTPGQLIVLHDDLDLPFTKIKVKSAGGSGGHKGVESIINALGTDRFVRIRLGIGKPDDIDPADYVLQDFTEDERDALDGFISKGRDVLEYLIENGVERAMNKFNKKGDKNDG